MMSQADHKGFCLFAVSLCWFQLQLALLPHSPNPSYVPEYGILSTHLGSNQNLSLHLLLGLPLGLLPGNSTHHTITAMDPFLLHPCLDKYGK